MSVVTLRSSGVLVRAHRTLDDCYRRTDISALTLVTFAVVVYGVLSKKGYGRALALGGATPVGAALVVGGVALPTFFAAALGAAAGVVLTWLERVHDPERSWPAVPAGRCLLLFGLSAVLTTLVAPLVFDGLETLPAGGPSALAAGVVTKSNYAQIIYLVLSICVVFFLARSRTTTTGLVGLAALTTTLLSFWAWLGTTGLPFPAGLFDNSPGFIYQNTLPGGAPRVRGILSEPAGLATSSLVTLAYGASRMWMVPALPRIGIAVVMAMAAYLGAISTSATFYVAGAALLVVVLVVQSSLFVSGRSTLGPRAVAGLCALAVASTWLLPLASAKLADVVDGKLSSSSYEDRTGSDTQSFHLVLETAGFGVGLGANRASSFIATLLSTVGIAGTAVFVAVVWILLRDSWPVRSARPAAWALIALLVTKAISSPDLADTSGVLWLSLGVLAHAALVHRGADRAPVPEPPQAARRRRGGPAPPPSRPAHARAGAAPSGHVPGDGSKGHA